MFVRNRAPSVRPFRYHVAYSLLAFALVLHGCSSPAANTDSGDDATSAAANREEYTIGVSFYDNQVIPLYVEMEEGMEDAAQQSGAEVAFSYANFDPAAQVDQIQQFITRGMDIILVSPFDRTAVLPAYEAARDAGIPIISFANRVDEEHEDLFVGRDWAEMGTLAMEAVIDELGGQGRVAMISGPPETDVARQVAQGWESTLESASGVEVAASLVDPDMSREKGLDLANTLLASDPDVDAIVCTIDQICLGAAQAIEEQGLDQSSIFLASIDADAEAVEQVRNGSGIDWTVSLKGFQWGQQVIDVAIDYLNGDVPDEHTVPNEFVVVTADSVGDLSEEDLK